MSDSLKAKIKAANRANAYAMELHPKLVAALRPFVGKKVVNQTGALSERLKNALPELPCDPSLNVYCCSYRNYSLDWNVKACETYPDKNRPEGTDWCIAEYYETSVRVGKIENGVLVSLYEEMEPRRTDYTVEDVIDKQKAYQRAKREAEKLHVAELSMFGEGWHGMIEEN